MLTRLPRLYPAASPSRVWSHTFASRIAPPSRIARALNTVPNMSLVTDAEIIQRFEKLSLSKPQVITHGVVKNGAEWKAELEKIGKGDVSLTKTVSCSPCLCPSSVL